MLTATTYLKSLGLLMTCLMASVQLYAQPLYETHWASGSDPEFSGSAAATLTQTLDSACSLLSLSVIDPMGDPMPPFNAIILNPQLPGGGGDLTDLSGNMSFHVRVRSRDSVRLGLQLRAGDGSNAFRTDRLEVVIPGDTTAWTEHTFIFDASSLAGFDSTDLRDAWFFLDRGDENFAGNEFVFDYFSIGAKPDSANHSDCSLLPPFEFPWILHWNDTADQVPSGSAEPLRTQTIDPACSQLLLAVTEPVLNPHPDFTPMILDIKDAAGNDVIDLSGQLTMYVRARSAETVTLSIALVSGEGGQDERTLYVEGVIPAGLDQWTELTYDFRGANLSGFDSTDFRFMFTYLDRGTPNWPGNEVYLDYLSLGAKPDEAENSSCVDTATVSIDQLAATASAIYPNPLLVGQPLQIQTDAPLGTTLQAKLMSIRGKMLWQQTWSAKGESASYTIIPPRLSAGMYLLEIVGANGRQVHRLILR